MKISNVDTLSALFDRLITERIKWYFFQKDGDAERARVQLEIIAAIRTRIKDTLLERPYEFHAEQRTFKLMDNLEALVVFDAEIGESDRARLAETHKDCPDASRFIEQEIRLRTANESRSKSKNFIDWLWSEL